MMLGDERCTQSYCLPEGTYIRADATSKPDPHPHPVFPNREALIAENLDINKVAVLAGDVVHIYDAASRAHESSFSIRGDNGVTSRPIAVYWSGDAIFIEASNGTTSPVWVFKTDGTPMGPIKAADGAGNAVLSTYNGSFVLLDRSRVAISERGFSSLTIYEIATGKRTKVVRKVPPSPCTRKETDAFWSASAEAMSQRCENFMKKNYAPLVGADAVAWKEGLLVLLRKPRLGELAVLDPNTLVERRTIAMPWCE